MIGRRLATFYLSTAHSMSTAATTTTGIRVRAFGGPEVLRVEPDVPLPALGPEDVRVRAEAAGVNPVDTYIRQVSWFERYCIFCRFHMAVLQHLRFS